MQALFSPAVALMNRIRYNTKFLLIGGAVTLVILVLLSSVYSSLNRDIESARNEQAGLQMLKPINQVARVMQQHRGLSAGVLSGNEAMKDKRAAKEKEVSDALVAADAALSTKLREAATWNGATFKARGWHGLNQTTSNGTPPCSPKCCSSWSTSLTIPS